MTNPRYLSIARIAIGTKNAKRTTQGRNTLIRRYRFCPVTNFLLAVFFLEVDFAVDVVRRAGCFRGARCPLEVSTLPSVFTASVDRFPVLVAGNTVRLVGGAFLVGGIILQRALIEGGRPTCSFPIQNRVNV